MMDCGPTPYCRLVLPLASAAEPDAAAPRVALPAATEDAAASPAAVSGSPWHLTATVCSIACRPAVSATSALAPSTTRRLPRTSELG